MSGCSWNFKTKSNQQESEGESSESESERENDEKEINSSRIENIIAISKSLLALIKNSDLKDKYDLARTKAAIKLMELTRSPSMSDSDRQTILGGAYWIMMNLNTDKYTLSRVMHHVKFEQARQEARVQDTILDWLDLMK